MVEILALMPKATLHYVTNRFGHCGFREDCELLGEIVRTLGEEATNRLIETLQTAPASEAAETVGLLTQLAPDAVAKILPVRLSQWPQPRPKAVPALHRRRGELPRTTAGRSLRFSRFHD